MNVDTVGHLANLIIYCWFKISNQLVLLDDIWNGGQKKQRKWKKCRINGIEIMVLRFHNWNLKKRASIVFESKAKFLLAKSSANAHMVI